MIWRYWSARLSKVLSVVHTRSTPSRVGRRGESMLSRKCTVSVDIDRSTARGTASTKCGRTQFNALPYKRVTRSLGKIGEMTKRFTI
jgi:hypothetical protein